MGMASTSADFDRALAREIAGGCIARRARELARELTTDYNDALGPTGPRITQLSMLVAIGLAGEARAGDVAETLGLEQSTVSRNVARMREAGWISAGADPADARATVLRLTPAGGEALDAAGPAWRRAQRDARERIRPALRELEDEATR